MNNPTRRFAPNKSETETNAQETGNEKARKKFNQNWIWRFRPVLYGRAVKCYNFKQTWILSQHYWHLYEWYWSVKSLKKITVIWLHIIFHYDTTYVDRKEWTVGSRINGGFFLYLFCQIRIWFLFRDGTQIKLEMKQTLHYIICQYTRIYYYSAWEKKACSYWLCVVISILEIRK